MSEERPNTPPKPNTRKRKSFAVWFRGARTAAIGAYPNNLITWVFVAYGLNLLTSAVYYRYPIYALEGGCLLVAGVALVRGAASRAFPFLLIAGIAGAADTVGNLTSDGFNLYSLGRTAWQVWLIQLAIRDLRRDPTATARLQFQAGEPTEQATRVNRDARAFLWICVATAIVYLILAILAAALSTYFTTARGPTEFFVPLFEINIPMWLVMVLEFSLLLIASWRLRRGSEWARVVVLVLCGYFAIDFVLFLLFGVYLSAWDVASLVAWSYGFVLLGSRSHVSELAEDDDSEDPATAPAAALSPLIKAAKAFDKAADTLRR